jgi:hypothetical protein
VLLPSLAKAVGVDGAIVLQQLHYYLGNPQCGREHEGHRWVYNTYEDWQQHDFPFWPAYRVGQILRQLQKRGLVLSCQPETRADGACNRRKYYRIDYDQLDSVVTAVPSHYCETQRSVHCETQRSRTKTTDIKKEGKGGAPATIFRWKEPKVPYPKSARGMYRALERLGIEPNPDYDGDFFRQMRAAGWTVRGQRVYDWPATYAARLESIVDGVGGSWD